MRTLIIFLIALALAGCKVKKTTTETKTEVKTEYKTEYIDTSKTKIEKVVEYQYIYDTINQKVYVFPKKETFTQTENKGITAKKDSVIVYKTKTEFKELKKPKSGFYWQLIGIAAIVLFMWWFFDRIKKFIGF